MWWYTPWSENIKKRACRYLLQRYLGNFLEEKLTLDQLSVDLYNGTGTVSEVSLDCEALNELGDSQNWPLEIVDGYMREITLTIPWSTLLKDDSVVEINGLCVTVQPKVRAEPASSMLESMWSSMSSSMQLAAECMRQEDGPSDAHPVEGIEMFAQAIDSILSRVKVRFVNTKIRIEHVPKNSDRGIALEIHIKHIDYFDEAGSEPPPDVTDPEKPKTFITSTYINKRLIIEGVTLYTDEFPSKLRTMARSLVMEKSAASSQPEKSEGSQVDASEINFQSTLSDVFYETRSVIASTEPEPFKNEFVEQVLTENVFKREVTPEERANQPEPILFAKFTGKQELALKIKHSEEAVGPKVDLQLTLGSLIQFLTPRQLHTIVELIDGLNQPDLEDTSNIPTRPSGGTMQCKPMGHEDFQRVEEQLLRNFTVEPTKANFGMSGWTGHSLDDSDAEERFHPMTSAANPASDSFTSSASSMSTSMTSSVHMPAMQPRIKRNRKVPQIDGDPTAEVSHINVKIASCCCILLHKDILVPVPLGTDCVTPASAKKMQQASSEFFAALGLLAVGGTTRRDLDLVNDTFDRATSRSQLRLITMALTLDGSDKKTSHGSQTGCEATISHLLLRETLFYNTFDSDTDCPQSFDLIRFDWKEEEDRECESPPSSLQPNVRITFRQTLKYARVSGEKKLIYPATDITIKCTPFAADVELTLLERMCAGRRPPAAPAAPAPPPPSHTHLNFTLQCDNIDAVLRFPIADLRPALNREVRRVRPDYLLFKFQDVLVTAQQTPSVRPLPTTVTLRATTLDLYYYENSTSQGTHIARAGMDDSFDTNLLRGAAATLPTISLTFQPSKPPKGPFDPLSDDEAFEPASNPMTTSMHIMNNLRNSAQPTPFSNKKTAHQSTIKHEDDPENQAEELIVPGNEEEMLEFTSYSVGRSAIHLDLNLPVLSLQLESKQLYEIVYNRINSDLLLWEPQLAEQYEISPHMAYPANSVAEPNIYPAFGMPKGGGYESDSASSSSEEENLYYSTYDDKMKQRKAGAAKPAQAPAHKDSHNFCLTLKVGKGLLTIYAPVRDSNKRVVPGQMGELVLEASSLSLCQVSGINGRAKTAQLCLRASKAVLYHDALMSIPSEKPGLRLHGTSLPLHLKDTIYPSGRGVLLKDQSLNKDILSLALSVEPQQDLPSFKKICLTLGIEHATLRHRGHVGIAWMSQLLDVLDVVDYPVPGYQPSNVLTELHVHVWNCAIDYRPLYLPIRTVATLGNFSVASNVIAQTNTSSLRFLAQDCALYLNHLVGCPPNATVPQDDGKHPDLLRDYVCVMDVGLFELSLRIADKATTSGPHVDLCASNNIVNIHTCWDSASALCRLVTYAATDGDASPPAPAPVPVSRHASVCSDRDLDPAPLVGLDDHTEEIRELSPNEIQLVNDMMAEAMKESPDTTVQDENVQVPSEKEGVELFYFPDESNMKKMKQMSMDLGDTDLDQTSIEYEDCQPGSLDLGEEARPTNAHVARDLGDPNRNSTPCPPRDKKLSTGSGNNTDDEYCIVDAQAEGDDELAEPVVTWFGTEPVPMIDNHFSKPAARRGVLEAPKNFPMPNLRYTLCEMSLVWHLYGGHDFRVPGDNTAGKRVTISDDRHGSPTATKRNTEYEPYEAGRHVTSQYRTSGVRWTAGCERVRPPAAPRPPTRDRATSVRVALNKVKFRHETYPAGGTHASRQTLAIKNVEILDRLANSNINKFLSHYKLKDEPERTYAHMVEIKAAHLRPEPALSAQECCLKVSLLPLRFNIDQDTLAFIVGFFSKLGTDETSDDDTKSLGGSSESGGSRQATPTHRPPVMSVGKTLRDPPPTPTSLGDADTLSLNEGSISITNEDPLMETYEAERLVSDNLIQLEEDFQRLAVGHQRPATRQPDAEPVDDSPIYFRRVVFSPEVYIRLDYVGKRVDLTAGPVAGLLMGLGQLNCSELELKRLYHRHGLLGLERLVKWALHEWLSDIKRHQLPGLLGGIGPMHSLLQFVTGIRDLLWLPVEQWRRDGRLVLGLRRGAASFTARTAVAALDITTRLLHVIQATAETAFDMLTPGPTLQLQSAYDRRDRRRRRRRDPARHPADIREGVASAYQLVREGFAETATTMAIAARSERGVGVLRHLPGAAVTPLALAAAGAADVLGGVRAHLAPESHRDHADKWRPHTDSSTD